MPRGCVLWPAFFGGVSFFGAKVGAAIGTVAPGAGNVVGAVVGAVVGIGIAVAVDIYEDKNGNTLRDKGKDWVYGIYKSITGKER